MIILIVYKKLQLMIGWIYVDIQKSPRYLINSGSDCFNEDTSKNFTFSNVYVLNWF